jgi:hypothetical protein
LPRPTLPESGGTERSSRRPDVGQDGRARARYNWCVSIGFIVSEVDTKTVMIRELAKSLLMLVGMLTVWLAMGAALVAGLIFLLFGSGNGVVETRVVSPNGRIAAEVVRDDCGATCGCRIRVDLSVLHRRTYKEVYRDWSACDAELVWLECTKLQIRPEQGGQDYGPPVYLDMRELGVMP